MTRIWSGRLQDQVYAGMAERLVRQSNNARLSPNVGVNPRVRRILARMHRAGLLENMAGLWLPDMYTADSENRVERMGGLTAEGALEQSSVGSRPTLTRDDERSNLFIQSILPGTLGTTTPTGWATQDGNGEIVESDDPTGGHQAHFHDPVNQRFRVRQSVSLNEGQDVLVGYFVEAINYTSGNTQTTDFGGIFSASVLGTSDSFATLQPGQWAWRAARIGSTTSGFVTIGAGTGGNTTGTLRLSRPYLINMPVGWLGWSSGERQAFLANRYAATAADRQYAGTPAGLRAAHIGVGQHLEGPTFNLGDHSEFSFFALINCHRDGVVEGYQRLSDGNGTGFVGQANGDVRACVVMAGSDHDLDAAPSGGRRNQWILYGISATVGGQLLYSQNGSVVDSTTLPDTAFADDVFPFAMSEGDANYTLDAAFLALGQAFDESEHAALHEILTEAP